MSDSFADLWSSSAPLPPKPKPQTLSSASSSSTTSTSSFARQNSNSGYGANTGSKPDLFAMLSSSGSGNSTPRYGAANGNGTGNRPSLPPSRTMTPSSSSLGPGLGLGAGAGIARSGSAASGGNTGGDAFSDLFSSSNQGSSNSSNMTLAARLAMEAEQRRGGGVGMGMGRASPGKQSARGVGGGGDSDDAAWAGLDSLASGGSSMLKATKTASTAKHAPTAKVKVDDDADDWGLADFGAASSSSRARTQTTAQSIASAAAAKERKKAAVSLWDLDDFKGGADGDGAASSAAPVRTYSPSPVTAHPPRSSKPLYLDDDDGAGGGGVASPDKDFDFGSREDLGGERGRGLLDFDEDEDGFGLGGGRRNGNANEDGYGQGRGHGHGHRGAGDDEDDILGMLSKPVEVVRARVGVENRAQHTPPPASNTSTNTSRAKSRTTTSSPPPHILGQLVEMGFSVSQAKKALGATTNGMDVQAALESLLGGGGSGSDSGGHATGAGSSIGIGEEREERGQAAPPPAAAPPRTRAPPKGQKERERERLEKQRLAASSSSSSHPSGPSSSSSHSTLATDNIQEQADKLLAQASEIGRGVFSKASAFWKERKERVVKAYEEREAGGGTGLAPGARPRVGGARGGAGAGGKPRWMMENEGIEDEDGVENRFGRGRGRVYANGGGKDGFRDGWEGVEERVGGPGGEVFDEGKVDVEEEVEEVDLFSSDVPAAARSRSKPQSQSQVGQQGPSSSLSSSLRGGHAATARPQPSSASISSQRTRTPIPIPTRTLVPASASSLSLALKHKTLGTEQFKLGQHAAAAESYTLALGALPEGHLLRVPLLTNRALARLKIGEYAGVIRDCEGAVEGAVGGRVFAAGGGEGGNSGEYGVEDPLGPSSSAKSKAKIITPPPLLHPSTLPPALLSAARTRANEGGWAHPQGVGVDLLDGYVKALKRAAEACEGRERWEEAGVWWGVLSRAGEGGGEWVDEKARKEAVRGGVRCRKMLDGDASSQAAEGKPQVKPTPKTQQRRPPVKPAAMSLSSSSATPSTSAAVKALQTTNAQAEADDAAKHALKDSVDARLSAWKSGKEANIRALLASLEIVLSDGDGAGKGLGMQGLKMGMADLVSAGQVKKGYMKAIGRVHPDKLNTSNSTLEQRMLANGVFGGLNEAWIAFQATQK